MVAVALVLSASAMWVGGDQRTADALDQRLVSLSEWFLSPDAASLSADGRVVLMSSTFDYRWRVLDRSTGRRTLLPGRTDSPAILVPDGSAVLLQAGDIFGLASPFESPQIYRYDLSSNSVRRLTTTDFGVDARQHLVGSSHDGRYLLLSVAPYEDEYPNVRSRVVVLDTMTGTSEVVDDALPGLDRRSTNPSISADGQVVAFQSHLGNCEPNCVERSYVVDRVSGAYEQIDIAPGGSDADANSSLPSLSADGQHVLFYSRATNIVTNPIQEEWNLYVRDRRTATTQLIAGRGSDFTASISGDGTRVVYLGLAPTDAGDPYLGRQPILVDRTTGSSGPIVSGVNGEIPNQMAEWVRLTADGRTVVFQSDADNLIAGVRSRNIYALGPVFEPPTPPPPRRLRPRRLVGRWCRWFRGGCWSLVLVRWSGRWMGWRRVVGVCGRVRRSS